MTSKVKSNRIYWGGEQDDFGTPERLLNLLMFASPMEGSETHFVVTVITIACNDVPAINRHIPATAPNAEAALNQAIKNVEQDPQIPPCRFQWVEPI